MVLEPSMLQYHEKVNKYWRDHSNSTLSHITLVSSGGGENDVQVRSGLTILDGVGAEHTSHKLSKFEPNHSIANSF